MKKMVVIFLVMMLIVTACSMPRLVKVEDSPDPTATSRVVAPSEIDPEPPSEDPEPVSEDPQPTTPPSDSDILNTNQVLWMESFSSDDGTWNTGVWAENAGEDIIADGEYRMNVIQDSYMIWSKTFDLGTSDVIMEVEARLYSGSQENGQGFVCRYVDQDNFYFLHIGSDGWYSIDKYVNNEYENLASDYASSDVIDPDWNLIRAECDGSRLALWSNGQLLAEVEDSSLPSGQVGLFTRSWDEGDITIAYDNFAVYDASMTPVPQGLEAKVLFSDDFETDPGTWKLGTYKQSDLDILSGWLTYEMKQANWESWDVTRKVDAANVKMEAYFSNDSEQVENIQGFVCRYQDEDNFYRISFGNDGYVRIGKRLNGEWTFFVDGYDTTDSIDPDFNWVEASCEGNTLSLWVDNELVAQGIDPENSFTSGDVGFIVGTFDDPNVVVSIDDFVVTSLD
ncbi:MAG: hypothetical protein PHR54_04505 [Anaerolineaceae bacterium]|jgi:hypothetical protein|nr:hypothetical protein [Anaerolineaceae bacterium]